MFRIVQVIGLISLLSACNDNTSNNKGAEQEGSTHQSDSADTVHQSAYNFKVCSIVPAAKDFPGGYNIKIGGTIMDGNHSVYESPLEAGKDIAELLKQGVCLATTNSCSMIRASDDFPGGYNIQIGDAALVGNHSVYGSPTEASKDIAELINQGVCKPNKNQCAIVRASADFPGGYLIKIGDITLNGNHSVYGSLLDAGKDIAQFREDGTCQ